MHNISTHSLCHQLLPCRYTSHDPDQQAILPWTEMMFELMVVPRYYFNSCSTLCWLNVNNIPVHRHYQHSMSPQRLNLERSMDQFRRELTDAQLKEISGANRMSINHEIQKMQAGLGREKSLCRIGRMSRFLDAMEEVEKLVSIFLNVSEAVAFIWVSLLVVIWLCRCTKTCRVPSNLFSW